MLEIKRKNRWGSALGFCIGAALLVVALCVTIANQQPANPHSSRVATAQRQPKPAAAAVVYGPPVQLEIPSLNVTAAVLDMGLTPDGDMEAPARLEDAGWYKYGVSPGNTGSAVIAGHVGVDQPGVFALLDQLRTGDRIIVTDNKNQAVMFVVRQTRVYGQDQQPAEVFTSSYGAHLNLITCSGEWDQGQRRYVERLVVFAHMVER